MRKAWMSSPLVLVVGLGAALSCASSEGGAGSGGAGPADGGARDGGPAYVGPLQITRTRAEYRLDPVGIDVPQPRLDWILASSLRGEKQTAYRVLVASSPSLLQAGQGDLWDSGKVVSDQTTQVVYQGKPLASRQSVWWKVQSWDRNDVVSAWSDVATWEMGLLAPADWQAQWVTTPSPSLTTAGLDWIWYPEGTPATSAPAGTRLFRRSFTLPAGATVKAASLAITADDTFAAYVNQAQVAAGTDWSAVQAADVAGLVTPGTNTIAILATNVSAAAGVLAQVQVDLADGSRILVPTDGSWRTSNQPPTAGWQAPSYDDSAWSAATVAAPFGQGPWGSPAVGVGGGGPARYLRRSFNVASPVRRARLYATALGLYEPSVNGQRVGAQHFSPGWTDYDTRLQVQTYDVTSLLAPGENVVGLVVGDGWYQGKVGYVGRKRYGTGPIRAFAQLEVDLADGTHQVVATDGSWDTTNGPIAAADLLDGETYDARREMPGWDAPGFTAALWSKASISPPTTTPALVAQPDDGVQIETERPAATVKQVTPGVFVYDLGQNISGWAKLQVQGPAGATLTLRFAEVLNPDGSIYTANLRGAAATDRYTLRGGSSETYEPRFTSHGFRYVELSGDTTALATPPSLSTVTGVVAHAATPPTGTLVTSDPVINQLQSNVLWSQKDNFTAVPTDCPQRDERLGWMGDAQIFVRTATLNMDVASFFTKWTRDVDDAQDPNGAFGDVSPNPMHVSGSGTPAWADAGVIVPWTAYLAYGDTRILSEHYPAMVGYLAYVTAANPNFLWQNSRGSDFGDWLSVNSTTSNEVLATAFYAHSVDLVSKAAHVLGKADDEAKYSQLFASIVQAFDAAYVSSDGHITGDTQTTYALALRFGLLPAATRPLVASLLKADIQAHGGYLTTGFIGVGHLLPALSSMGMTDVAYTLLDNDGFPSWRYEIDRGATTTWERWDGIEPNGSFETPAMNSFNHYSFGSVDEWMYATIGGLQLDEANPGWKAFAIRPQPGGGLTSANASLASPYGTITSAWTLAGGTFTLTVTVPVNTTANVYLPYAQGATLDGAPAPAPAGDGGYAVGSGTYVFTARAP